MEVSKLRKKTQTELQEVLRELEKEYQGVVTDILQNKEKNVRKPRFIRKSIARVKTILGERERKQK